MLRLSPSSLSVIPAKAGIQIRPHEYEEGLDSRFRGNDNIGGYYNPK